MLDKMPVKTKTFQIKGDFEGWEFEARVNPPLGLFLEKLEALQTVGSDPLKVAPALYDLLEMVVTAWNFKDEQGQPIPVGIVGLKQLPMELLLAMSTAITGEAFTVPLASGSS